MGVLTCACGCPPMAIRRRHQARHNTAAVLLWWVSLLLNGFLGRSLLRDSLGRGLLRRGLRAAGGFGGRRLSRGLWGSGRGGCCLLRRNLGNRCDEAAQVGWGRSRSCESITAATSIGGDMIRGPLLLVAAEAPRAGRLFRRSDENTPARLISSRRNPTTPGRIRAALQAGRCLRRPMRPHSRSWNNQNGSVSTHRPLLMAEITGTTRRFILLPPRSRLPGGDHRTAPHRHRSQRRGQHRRRRGHGQPPAADADQNPRKPLIHTS